MQEEMKTEIKTGQDKMKEEMTEQIKTEQEKMMRDESLKWEKCKTGKKTLTTKW